MEYRILVYGILLFLALLSIKLAKRVQLPFLVLFLFLGMLMGSEGLGRIAFDDFYMAQDFGNLALLFILFSGALETKKIDAMKALYPSATLATLGVFLTAMITAVFAKAVTDFTWMESFLFGSFVSSTDAAAVLSSLGQLPLQKKLRNIIEIESGSNDPMAYSLILFFLSLYHAKGLALPLLGGILLLGKQLLFGGILGYLFGKGSIPFARKARITGDEFMAIYLISMLFLCYALTSLLGGNGFLAIYIMGILVGNESFDYRINCIRSFRIASWLMQISMFVLLGLLVNPSELLAVMWKGCLLALIILFVGRISVVYLVLSPFKLQKKEKFFISWAGLKGAVPIIFSLIAMRYHFPHAAMMFNTIFFMVVFSVLLQGTTLPFWAKKLHLVEEEEKKREGREVDYDDLEALSLRKLKISRKSPYVDKEIRDLHLNPKTHIVSVKREGEYMTPSGDLKLLAGDIVLFSGF